jgi:hypothetical protein
LGGRNSIQKECEEIYYYFEGWEEKEEMKMEKKYG